MKIAFCWGFFAPLHVAHLDLFESAKKLVGDGKVIVLVNDDEQLKKKKYGLVVQEEWDRARLVSSIKTVDHAFIVKNLDHSYETLLSTVLHYMPDEVLMCMGGDITENNVDSELEWICEKLGIKLIYGVGGSIKERSSTNIIQNIIDWYKEREKNRPPKPIPPDIVLLKEGAMP